jgi:hypothetical protein
LVVDNKALSDVPLLADMVHNVKRPTPVSRFASAFRSCRTAVAGEIGAQILSVYQQISPRRRRSSERLLPSPAREIVDLRAGRCRFGMLTLYDMDRMTETHAGTFLDRLE